MRPHAQHRQLAQLVQLCNMKHRKIGKQAEEGSACAWCAIHWCSCVPSWGAPKVPGHAPARRGRLCRGGVHARARSGSCVVLVQAAEAHARQRASPPAPVPCFGQPSAERDRGARSHAVGGHGVERSMRSPGVRGIACSC